MASSKEMLVNNEFSHDITIVLFPHYVLIIYIHMYR